MDGQQVVSSAVRVTDQMINSMRPTKMWTKFLSIMGFIVSGFIVLIGTFVFLAGILFPQVQGAKIPPVAGLIYMLFSIFYIIPSVYLFKYSSALDRFLCDKMESELESALSYQKSFWKFTGIVCVIGIIFAVVGIVAAIAIPLMVKH
ncbi:MAG: DUF5362 family protein [Smithella sp.]|jgi:hypothetical protein